MYWSRWLRPLGLGYRPPKRELQEISRHRQALSRLSDGDLKAAAQAPAMSRAAAASLVMFGAPFLILAACYAAVPGELAVLRIPLAGAVLRAPKSLFTVFRVPLMNLTHGLMAAVMLSRAGDFKDPGRRASYSRVFSTLLFAVAFKSNFEALEMSGSAWLGFGTLVSVIGGLGLALVYARGVPFPWPELRLTRLGKATLVLLAAMYVGMVIGTLMIARDST